MHSPLAPGMTPATPEDLIRVTKNVTVATAKAVAAGASNLQADIVAAANMGRRAISEMLVVCRVSILKVFFYKCLQSSTSMTLMR